MKEERNLGITASEFEYSQRIDPGSYTVKITAGGITRSKLVNIRTEPDGVKQVPVRK